MDLNNISTEELYEEIARRETIESFASYKINFRDLRFDNNYNVFVSIKDFTKMTENSNKEIAECDITLYDDSIATARANMKKLYFYSSFRDMILDSNVSVDEMLCKVTNENKKIDLNDIELEYITIKLNDGKEAYLVL